MSDEHAETARSTLPRTRIVFAGVAEVEVALHVEQVKDALRQDGHPEGLAELELTEHDRSGNPIRIYINRDQVAFITDAGSMAPPVERPPADDELRDESPAAEPGASGRPVTDLWGNPIRPRRRRH